MTATFIVVVVQRKEVQPSAVPQKSSITPPSSQSAPATGRRSTNRTILRSLPQNHARLKQQAPLRPQESYQQAPTCKVRYSALASLGAAVSERNCSLKTVCKPLQNRMTH
eukprot:CAMPEP_0114612042 /NCGR_PEP_ID=MMETSP0168-20121206/4422_1 /TAXON_ID=95228 ORGANISM="Vannella sp., Strain DIVA3 517/6/12" /NCGR_SAMPLE_ID=MMETSP0168 /ASSEMBLY_ACC=CAM_ASM_000044 /LENGTH=109 /DNA_ID=CAMNT_0001823023 /DNA_START=663 /DNA_END=992 /DNA_ORIENTATION=+